MRKPKNKPPESKGNFKSYTISPSPTVFGRKDPEALKRQISTLSQTDGFEDIIIYGPDNALPLRIAKAVEESPAASSCIDTVAKFIKGSGFSDPELMKTVIDEEGTTLWDLHSALSDSLALFWGFSVNFKFDRKGRIINTFQLPFECVRFAAPGEKSNRISNVKYNPYYGTTEYRQEFTQTYPVFNIKQAVNSIANMKKEELDAYPGQVFYYGKTSPLSRFYPKPKYWSAKEAIEADHKLQEFHNEELDNGFFQSALINIVGNPSEWSKNPRLQQEYEDESGVKRTKSLKTVGEEFNDMMADSFAGSKKAGTAMVLWSLNKEQAVTVEEFPTGVNGERIISTQDSITKTITIATQVPSILANISEGVSLGSGGSEIQKAVELMQSRTVEWRTVLENFYNNTLLPNLQKSPEARVEIQNYNPVSVPVEINKEVWEVLNEQEKIAYIKKTMPDIEIIRPVVQPALTPPTTTTEGEPVVDPANPEQPATVAPNEALKNLKIADLNKIQKIVARYNLWKVEPTNPKALTYEQAKQMLSSFGFTEEELNAWLVTPEEL